MGKPDEPEELICPHCKKEVKREEARVSLLTRTYHGQCIIDHLLARRKGGDPVSNRQIPA